MDLNFIIIIVASVIIAGFLGIGMGILAQKFKDWMLRFRGRKFLEGKTKNNINLDGEIINVNKFRWKDRDGRLQYTEIKPFEEIKEAIPQIPQQNPEPERKFKRFSDYR